MSPSITWQTGKQSPKILTYWAFYINKLNFLLQYTNRKPLQHQKYNVPNQPMQ